MADFAVIVTEVDNSKKDQYFQDHMLYLDNLRAQGRVIANGKFVNDTVGLILFRANSLKEVEELVEQSPFAIHGVRKFEIKEWDVKWGQ